MNEPTNIAAAIPQNAEPRIDPRLVCDRLNVWPSAGRMSPRVTNEKAEAINAMQLATNRRRGFMRSVSEGCPAPGGVRCAERIARS